MFTNQLIVFDIQYISGDKRLILVVKVFNFNLIPRYPSPFRRDRLPLCFVAFAPD
ncbi:hypothetical protein BD94_2923 [Elizabethkingia anophelis NUHP1]|uniref:Uncharacterized protein n=1 Tax=Elizabethkingia anophelis NUHP1 TaxID=1338011 RepID=A0A077EJK6_9FLAO|nr:hypothetical protein BD94_2923 [Elizabethkingia anophelis NUHP1]